MPAESQVDRFLGQFRRITSSGKFIPEIDGLRFFAITSVALFHIHTYLTKGNDFIYAAPGESFRRIISFLHRGELGVELFFVISGFILAVPFANQYLRGGKQVRLGSYFLRRITRLEPPYFLAMILCFLLLYRRYHGQPEAHEYFSSLIASLFYSHNFIWSRDVLPLVNPVAWSLEIEVQFYILAPLLGCIYLLGKFPRRIVLGLLILSKLTLTAYAFPHRSLLDYYDFFLVGFLLADLYVCEELNADGIDWLCAAGSILAFTTIWMVGFSYLALAIGAFYYLAFKSHSLRGLLANRWLATIGGMCYSLYLVHWMLITTLGGRIMRKFTGSYAWDFVIHTTILSLLILIIGGIYFKLIERPCMRKDWPQRVLEFFKPASARIIS